MVVKMPLQAIVLRAELKDELVTEIITHNFVDIIETNSLEMISNLLDKIH